MKASTAAKNKSDRIDARTICNLLRCNLFPECFVMPPELAALRQQLRFRRTLVEETVKFKNRAAGLLMECGVEYEKKRLHGKRYFAHLTEQHEWIGAETKPLLEFSRGQIESLQSMDRRLIAMLERHPQLRARLEALQTIEGVGAVTALNWALEVGSPARFRSIGRAMSYCGLTSALRESAGRQRRGPLSKHRNAHLQSTLIETAKLAPLFNEKLKAVRQRRSLGEPIRIARRWRWRANWWLICWPSTGPSSPLRLARWPEGCVWGGMQIYPSEMLSIFLCR